MTEEQRARKREAMRRYRAKYPDKAAAAAKADRERNSENRAAVCKRWRTANKERVAAYKRAYQQRGRNGYKVEEYWDA